MNDLITDILLQKVQKNWKVIAIKFDNINEILQSIPRTAGIYQIKTTTPISVLELYETRNDNAHCKFKNKITESRKLGTLIVQEDLENGYVVYTGHQKFLRQRCKEHFMGSKGTGCLNLFEIEEFRKYNWWFEYLEVSIFKEYEDSLLFRTYLEQLHRANIGWPILCSQ